MQKKFNKSPLANVLGTAIVTSLTTAAMAGERDPFALKELSSGYLQVAEEAKAKEMTCGEGKCGAQMMKTPEMKCGAGMQEMMKEQQESQQKKSMEGKCAGMAPQQPETKTN